MQDRGGLITLASLVNHRGDCQGVEYIGHWVIDPKL
jgi:hypothetical protein